MKADFKECAGVGSDSVESASVEERKGQLPDLFTFSKKRAASLILANYVPDYVPSAVVPYRIIHWPRNKGNVLCFFSFTPRGLQNVILFASVRDCF